MEETLRSIKLYLHEKATSPLSGIFIGSWMVWNYRLLVTLLGEGSFSEKFKYIDETIYKHNYDLSLYYDVSINIPLSVLGKGMIFPAITTFFILTVYPKPALWAYSYWRKQQEKINAKKQVFDGNRLLSLDKSIEIYNKLAIAENAFKKERIGYQEEIDKLSEQLKQEEKEHQAALNEITSLNSEIKALKNPENKIIDVSNTTPQAKSEEMTKEIILKKLAHDTHYSLYMQDLSNITKLPALRVEQLVKQLRNDELISVSKTTSGQRITLTDKGKEHAIVNELV